MVLFVSGRITGEHVDMLRGVLEQESGGFAIDLKNVLLVDREAVKLLALSEANGTELRNCPPYIREWVTRERAETRRRASRTQGVEGPERISEDAYMQNLAHGRSAPVSRRCAMSRLDEEYQCDLRDEVLVDVHVRGDRRFF